AGFAFRIGEGRYHRLAGGGAKLSERPMDAGESKLAPGDVLPFEKRDLQTFGTCREVRRGKLGAIHDLHLTDARNVVDRQHVANADVGIRLLPRLAPRAILRRLPMFHEAGGQRPEALARLDGAPAHQEALAIA